MSHESDELPLLRRALLEIKQMRATIESLESSRAEPIAIVGMACHFPGADSPEEFWRLLHDGVDVIREVPRERWDIDAWYDPDPETPGKTYTRSGGFLNKVDLFDAAFFRITPREAVSMDPQHRLLLETGWEALERAGIVPNRPESGRTGVFIGITTNDYLHLQIEQGAAGAFDAYTATGNPLNFAAGRLSYVFGFQGPCMAVDAACASSLVTVHLACQSLRARECNAALAGGVNLVLSPQGSVYLSKTRALSPDGRCKTFDAAADGMSRSEGCGLVVLKRLSDAVSDGDRILACIRGSAIGQDGASSGLTAPNGLAQQALIREALRNAGVKPADVSYVEAHGTGTSLGDPIEVRSLAAVLSEGRAADQRFAIGSVKTNIGHCEAAAGIAGLIKTVLALGHCEIPPHLHLKTPTPHVAWDRIPVMIPARTLPWAAGNSRRIAGVSAFGLSGIIAHVVVEEPPAQPPLSTEPERSLHLLTISAKTPEALSQLSARYLDHLTRHSGESFADVCFTANVCRAHFDHRLAIAATGVAQACERLGALLGGGFAPARIEPPQHLSQEVEMQLALWNRGSEDREEILSRLARLYVRGADIPWEAVHRGDARRRVLLPSYPFQQKRYWFDRPAATQIPQQAPIDSSDCLYQVAWKPKPLIPPVAGSNAPGRWLILADRGGAGEALAARLRDRGDNAVVQFAAPAQELRQSLTEILAAREIPCRGVIHFFGLDDPFYGTGAAESLAEAQRLGCGTALEVLQVMAANESRESPRLWLVTRGAQAAGAASGIAQSTLWGLGKVIALEHPGLWGGLIDLDPAGSPEDAACLESELFNSDGETQIAWRAGVRHIARLARIPALPALGANFVFRSGCSYLITGGLGGIGLQLARWMVARGARHLVLLARHEPSAEARAVIAALERAGARVVVAGADVARFDQLTFALREATAGMPPLQGVIHAAGILADGALLQQTWPRFELVMAPKVIGSWNLHLATLDAPLDFFVLFSSAAALFGAPGQANYAAANAFLDALVEARRAQGLPAASVNWGPWAEAGMAAAVGSSGARAWDSAGLGRIPPAAGTETLERIVQAKLSRAAVLPVDWSRFVERLSGAGLLSFVSDVAGHAPPAVIHESTDLAARFRTAAPGGRATLLQSYLTTRVADVLGLAAQEIPPDRSLLETGIDSLMIMDLLRGLKKDLQLSVYPREFYERPYIGTLAKYLAAELDRGPAEAAVNLMDAPWPQAPALVSPDKRLPGIVFLLSSPRAGSTLLRVMLAGHPRLFCPPELHLLPFDNMADRRLALASSYLDEGLQRALMDLKALDAEQSQTLTNDLADRGAPIPEVYGILQELASGRLLVDKSPSYAASSETLSRAEAIFDRPRYIHLVRHPYAVIESFVRNRFDRLVPLEKADPYALAEQVWTACNENTVRFLAGVDPDRCHTVRYEHLVRDPVAAMGALCRFLEIPFDQAVVKPYDGARMTDGVHRQSLSIGDPGFLDRCAIEPALADAWKSVRLPGPLGHRARSVAAELEYELPHEAGMRERFLDAGGLKRAICEWGPPDAAPILCLHGILDQALAWEPVALDLAARGFRVIAPDLRGHGLSEHAAGGSSYHLLDFLADLDRTVRDIGSEQLTIVGHSMGAVIAAIFSGVRSTLVRNLVLIECPLPSGSNHEDTPDRIATQLDFVSSPSGHAVLADVRAAAQRLRLATPSLPDHFAMRLAQRTTEPCEGGVRWRWDARLQTRGGLASQALDGLDPMAYREVIRRITASVTLVFAESSGFVKPEQVALLETELARSRRLVLPGGHNLHLDASAALARVIADAAASRSAADSV